jgi:hypothetical protein
MNDGGFQLDCQGDLMQRSRRPAKTLRRLAIPLIAILGMTIAAPVAARDTGDDEAIVLPGAKSAEGIAAGGGETFYAGDLFAGDIYRGDVERGTAALLIDAPEGRQALGMKASVKHHLLFVAGGFTGQGYVYDTATGATVASYQFGAIGASLINDVILTRGGAWFTDSMQPKLYFVPLGRDGAPGPYRTLPLKGPAAEDAGDINLNGIESARNGKTLIVGNLSSGGLYTVDPATGESEAIAGVNVAGSDGLVRDGRRLYVVQPFSNQITLVRLERDLKRGSVEEVITSGLFQSPSTAALVDDDLVAVNAKFDTGIPPTAEQYEAVVLDD